MNNSDKEKSQHQKLILKEKFLRTCITNDRELFLSIQAKIYSLPNEELVSFLRIGLTTACQYEAFDMVSALVADTQTSFVDIELLQKELQECADNQKTELFKILLPVLEQFSKTELETPQEYFKRAYHLFLVACHNNGTEHIEILKYMCEHLEPYLSQHYPPETLASLQEYSAFREAWVFDNHETLIFLTEYYGLTGEEAGLQPFLQPASVNLSDKRKALKAIMDINRDKKWLEASVLPSETLSPVSIAQRNKI